MTNRLITATEFRNQRNISKKFDVDKINQCIDLAQSIDLYDVFNDFYFDLLANKDTAPYADLMSGATFTINGETYIQVGVKSLLIDLAYARYVYEINTNHTPFGMTQKITPDSQPIDRNMIKDLVKMAQTDADVKFRMIDKYLRNNASTFTRYIKGDNTSINTFSQRFSIL